MGVSVFVAKIFGICYLVIGIGLLFNQKAFRRMIDDFCRNTALLFYAGLLALVLGVVLILTHNVWAADWSVIITLIGWLGFIKGIWIIVFPNTALKFMQAYRNNTNLLIAHSVCALIFGGVLTFFGFFAA